MKKTFIDLFSGAGGMSCGLEMAGWHCLLGIDHDRA
ncbi:MAG: DNA cytosine methyltransferase, partial [Pseudanabaena sp.]